MKKEVRIGIFAIAMLLCAWAGIRFLSGIDLFSRSNVFYAAYGKIDGVQIASPVFIKGVKVGTVTDIRFNPSKSQDVVLELTVRRQYDIPSDSEARIYSDGLMGAKAIGITLGESPEMLRRGDTIRSYTKVDLMEAAGSELEFFKQKITRLTNELTSTLKGINMVVRDNAESINGTMNHLNSISESLDVVLASERGSLNAMINNLSEFSSALAGNAAQIDSMLTGLGRFSTALAESGLVENLAKTSDELNALLAQMNEGDGSVAQLLHDGQLYDNLTAAGDNLSLLLADLKEHPSRYVHFSLIGRSDAKEAERLQRDSVKAVKAADKAAKKAARKAAKE